MNEAPAIEFCEVWKGFQRHTGRLLLRAHLKNLMSNGHRREQFQALKNVSFRVAPGESLAVLGANGAGKSTLLSLVAGLASPDRGSVRLRGRVAALLELG